MIQPEFKPLIDILSGKLFRIPEYQRHYSWTNKQRKDLLDDILKLQKSQEKNEDRVHFMATIVCLKTQNKEQVGSNSFYIYDVVDGQQRLTTLIILLKAICLKLDNETEADEIRELNKLLIKDDGRLIILQNNHDNMSLLRNYLKDGKRPAKDEIKTIADENIANAITQCEGFVKTREDTINLLALIKGGLYFIFQSVEDKGAVYTIFEVLNSRGLEVDWLDKCKSMLMGLLYEHSPKDDSSVFDQNLRTLHSYWSEIYREIGLQSIPGHEIIRFASTLKENSIAGKTVKAEDAISFFKEDCSGKGKSANAIIKKIEENTLFLKDVTTCLSKLYKDKRLEAVTEITQARLMAVSIMLRKNISEDDRDILLNQWERTSFRIFGILRNGGKTKGSDYVKAAKEIFNNSELTKRDLLSKIVEIGIEYPIYKAVEYLRTNDCYTNWASELRYFFFRYDEYLSKTTSVQIDDVSWNIVWKKNPNDTVEHILPQDRNKWTSLFSEIQHQELVHSLGNLCLLSQPLNSGASNDVFSIKKESYKKTNLLSIRKILFTEYNEEINSWTPDKIKERTDILLKFAFEQWKDLTV